MLRSTVVLAFDEAATVIENSGLSDAWKNDESNWLRSFRDFSVAFARVSDLGRQVLALYGFDEFNNDSHWTSAYIKKNRVLRTSKYEQIQRGLRAITGTLNLLTPEHVETSSTSGVLSVVLVVDDGSLLDVNSLSRSLLALERLYSTLARLDDSDDPLQVVRCDSGSNLSFVVTGCLAAIDTMREILTFLGSQRGPDRAIGLIHKSLPVFDEIDKRVSDESLTVTEGQLLKEHIISAITELESYGVVEKDTLNLDADVQTLQLTGETFKQLPAPSAQSDETNGSTSTQNDEESSEVRYP